MSIRRRFSEDFYVIQPIIVLKNEIIHELIAGVFVLNPFQKRIIIIIQQLHTGLFQ